MDNNDALINQFNQSNLAPAQTGPGMPGGENPTGNPGIFNVIIPKPFVLSEQDKGDLGKIKDEIIDKVHEWEIRMAGFFNEYEVFADSYRMISKRSNSKPQGIFNSKSGETHRATEAKATLYLRMLTAHDPFFDAVAEGLDDWGMELSEQDLYAIEGVIGRQLQKLYFKEKLYRGMNSLALFGTVIFEEPWVSLPYGYGDKYFEGTDLVLRPLLTTAFDPFVFDIRNSAFMAPIDFPTKWRLRELASSDPETWDKDEIERVIAEKGEKGGSGGASKGSGYTYSRVLARKQRAGLSMADSNVFELINYHGKIDTNNSVVQRLWEWLGRQDDPKFCDFTAGALNADGIVRFHPTPNRTWHSLFKVAHDKLFELEGLGYGVGKTGRRHQREIDITQSQINNLLLLSILNMWKVGKYAGLKANQLNIKPNGVIELEDIEQLQPLRPPTEAINFGVMMLEKWKDDFRATTGATNNLQAVASGDSATEVGLTQNEAIRAMSVHAEIIAESFLREHLETMHVNNVNLLDNPIWVAITGTAKPMPYNKDNLPKNVGFKIHVPTDKDFRTDRIQRLSELINMALSIRTIVPETDNVIRPLWEETFRALGMNPRMLNTPAIAEQLKVQMQAAQQNPQAAMNQAGVPQQEVASEMAGASQGSGAQVQNSPIGPISTSPVAASLIQGI